ncbi:hypothetical protein L1887_13128 [Cichorium endivia]|nr:hypothetical protein L1887_13128 [Cichorium endivia]
MFMVANDFIFRHNSLPSNLNDSEDILLLDILVVAPDGTLTSMEDLNPSSESNSSNATAVMEICGRDKVFHNARRRVWLAYDEAAFSMRGSLAVLNFPVERVRESVKKMKYGFKEGCSRVVLLKKRHSQRSNMENKVPSGEKETTVLKDLGEYVMIIWNSS